MMMKMQKLWVENQETISSTFQNGENIFAVYHNYESDYHGSYSYSLCKITDTTGDFNTLNYSWVRYYVNNNKSGLLDIWKKVWSDEEDGFTRTYSFDYEEYSPKGNIEVYISTEDIK